MGPIFLYTDRLGRYHLFMVNSVDLDDRMQKVVYTPGDAAISAAEAYYLAASADLGGSLFACF